MRHLLSLAALLGLAVQTFGASYVTPPIGTGGGSLTVTGNVAGVFPIRMSNGTNINLDMPPTNRVMVMSSVASQMTNAFKRHYFDTNVAPSLSNLVAAAASGDVVELGAGDFRIGTQTIRVPVGVTLKGQGMGRTKIIGDVGVATNSIVQIMSTNVLEDFTIIANKPAYFQYPIGNNMIFGHPAATNAVIRRVQIFGETDALLISQSNRVSVTLEQVDFRSAWDVCNLIDLDTGDGIPGITATIIDSQLYSDSAAALNPQALLDPKSQPLIVSGSILDLINCVVTATNHKAITLSMQGFETNLVYVTDTIFRSAGTNGYGKQIDISTDSDVSVSKAIVSSQRIQDSDINGSSGVTYLPAQTGSLRVSTFRSLDDIFATDGLFGRTATITNELQAQTVNTTDLNATGSTVLKDAAVDSLTMALATASRVARIDANGNITNVVSGSPSTEYVKADGTTGTPSGSGSTNVVTMEIGRANITNGISMTGAGSAGLDLVSGTSAKTFSISVPDSLTASSTNKFDFNSPTAGQVIAVHSSSANVTVWTNATASGGSSSNFVTSAHGSAHITNQLRQGSVTYSNDWQIAQEGSRIRRQVTAKEGSTTIDNYGFAAFIATGTAQAFPASATNNSRVNTYSAASANADAGYEVNSAAVRPGFENRIHGVATIVSTTNQTRVWWALSSDSLSALTGSDMPSTKHVIGLRFNSETNSNWWFVAANGSSATNIDTGVAVQGGGYRARISLIENVTPTATNWVAWINGIPVATNTALLPTQPMKWIGSIRTFDAAAKTNAFEYLEHTAAP